MFERAQRDIWQVEAADGTERLDTLEQIPMLCRRPSFLCKQESRPPAPRFLDTGSGMTQAARPGYNVS